MKKDKKKIKFFPFMMAMVLLAGTVFYTGKVKASSKISSKSYEKDVSECFEEYSDDMNYIKEYLEFFENYDIVYPYEKYDMSSYDIDNLIDEMKTTSDCNYTFVGDIRSIVSGIKDNSFEYLCEHNEYDSFFPDDNSDDNKYKIQEYFENVLFEILEDIYKNGTNNVNEDFHKFKDLKIVIDGNIKNGIDGLYDDTDNLIALRFDYNKYSYDLFREQYCDIIKHNILHELNHARQEMCSCRLNNGQELSSMDYCFPYVSFITESSAESSIFNQDSDMERDFNYVYLNERTMEKYLFLLGMFKENNNVNDYYNAVFDSDWNRLFEFLDVSSKEDATSVMRIIDNINTLFGRSNKYYNIVVNSPELLNKDQNYTLTFEDVRYEVGFNFKMDILKYYLEKLIVYTSNHEDFSLEENLMMFNYAVNLVISDSYISANYYEDGNGITKCDYGYDSNFISALNTIYAKYREFLRVYYNVNDDDMNMIESDNDYLRSLFEMTNCIDSRIGSKSYMLKNKFPLLNNIKLYTDLSDNYYSFLEKDKKILIR